jgi:hypothetical protein
MDWIVFFGCILAGQLKDDFRTAGVFGDEFCYVVDIAVENDPTAVFGSVLRDCFLWVEVISLCGWFVRKGKESGSPTFVVSVDLGHLFAVVLGVIESLGYGRWYSRKTKTTI